MSTKEEILSAFNSKEGAWWAYREGIQIGYNEALNSLRNQAAIASMQGTITILGNSKEIFREIIVKNFTGDKRTFPNKIAEFAVACADALIEELKKK